MVQNISANILQYYAAFPTNERMSAREILQLSFESESESKTDPSTTLEAYTEYFHDYLAEAIEKRMALLSKDELVEQLRTLISEDSEEVDNSEEIAAMTNLVADFEVFSRGEEYITPETLSAATDVEA